jgi:L,D-peptidoglycan transpeptidase YkuD (ErfK/YbiS/YcfS/YnhG family)
MGAFAALALLAGCTSGAPERTASPPTPPSISAIPPSPSPPSNPASTSTTPHRPRSATPSTSSALPSALPSARVQPPRLSVTPARVPAFRSLPLGYSTGNADQVITVVAASHGSTTATLQAWQRSSGHWTPVGPSVQAWLGTGGIGTANEQSSATPEGSFTLTEAFGRDSDPGTRLPYRQTTPADWWISQPGPLYNTEQHCASGCPFTQGEPNEHLYYATPYYEYAVVIDYNRFPVHQGAGSAFFLHVTVGEPTQGCVSIDRDQLVRIMQWLNPAQHPRILMGVG